MPGRITPLVKDHFYHVFNRGSDKRAIFLDQRDYNRFIKLLYYYHFDNIKIKFSQFNKRNLDFSVPISQSKLVDIITYCLMPNHFHILLRQTEEQGISNFISKLSNSYTKYFNTRYKRSGPLLQGAFKAVLIENDEQLLHVSRYIHINPLVANMTNSLDLFKWSSFFEYKFGSSFCSTEEILKFYKSPEDYINFLEAQIEYGQEIEVLKHHLIDEP